MSSFKKKLEEMFETEEKIGIKNRDEQTGYTEDEFSKAFPEDTFESVSCLPDGSHFFSCTNSADYVVRTLGEGARYGFSVSDNQSVVDKEIIDAGGHDFAVLRGRFIVDLWIKHWAGSSQKLVFDLWDKKDHAEIKALYGDPEKWSCYEVLERQFYAAEDVPARLRLAIGKAGKIAEYSL